MNLLQLIIIFLALLVCGAVAFIAWELTADKPAADDGDEHRRRSAIDSSGPACTPRP